MRSTIIFSALAAVVAASSDNTSPFIAPYNIFESHHDGHNLLERANNCPTNSNSCSGIGYPAYCCATGSSCALDNSNHIACCPSGIYCVGSVPTTIAGVVQTGTTTVAAAGAISTVYDGASNVISVITTQYSDFRSDLGGWYTGFTARYGTGYTSFLNAQGQYVTTVQEVVNGVATASAITIALPSNDFVQAGTTAGTTATVTVVKSDGNRAKGTSLLGGLMSAFIAVVGWVL